MTQHKKRLSAIIAKHIKGVRGGRAVEKLIEAGLIDLRAAERLAILAEVAQLEAGGMLRVKAMRAAAKVFCCSYAKVRYQFYH